MRGSPRRFLLSDSAQAATIQLPTGMQSVQIRSRGDSWEQERKMAGEKGAISWSYNLEAALEQARSSKKWVLLDFTAAPM